ncbi:hypothetical protein VTL71DRAFT_10902 [Oculimacula yallundae]|uniref:Uncharacterized protein n=1 Tax=Oculimacula yallundae TaxID=86028 RepID=A0ABR4CWM7_9HELO
MEDRGTRNCTKRNELVWHLGRHSFINKGWGLLHLVRVGGKRGVALDSNSFDVRYGCIKTHCSSQWRSKIGIFCLSCYV